jgi:hypothetical protein
MKRLITVGIASIALGGALMATPPATAAERGGHSATVSVTADRNIERHDHRYYRRHDCQDWHGYRYRCPSGRWHGHWHGRHHDHGHGHWHRHGHWHGHGHGHWHHPRHSHHIYS